MTLSEIFARFEFKDTTNDTILSIPLTDKRSARSDVAFLFSIYDEDIILKWEKRLLKNKCFSNQAMFKIFVAKQF